MRTVAFVLLSPGFHFMVMMATVAGLIFAASRRRPEDPLLHGVALAYLAGLPLMFLPDRAWMLASVDAALVVWCWHLWTRGGSLMAWAVTVIAFGKCASRAAWELGWLPEHVIAAALINVGALAQVLIAGGYVDGLGRWLDDRARRHVPVRYHLLRHGTADVAAAR